MSFASSHLHRFGIFTVDSDQRVLLHNGIPLPALKVFDTLLILVENGGRIVEKEALMNRLWLDTFVEEALGQPGVGLHDVGEGMTTLHRLTDLLQFPDSLVQ